MQIVDLILQQFSIQESIPARYYQILRQFFQQYSLYCPEAKLEAQLKDFLTLLSKQVKAPYIFPHYHQKVTQPFNYYSFGVEFMRPLLNLEQSFLKGQQALAEAIAKLAQGDNVIFLSNHQIEPDPQIISLILEKEYAQFAENLIFVAGNRVTEDPLAAIFSLGRNLICIYSKKYIENPPEDRAQKQLHNRRSMQKMLELINTGGKSFFIAPSGGRDRANDKGQFVVADFDPQSLELLFLLAKKAKKNCHFYPLSILSYPIMPPPEDCATELGEQRVTKRSGAGLYFGQRLDLEQIPQSSNKHENRKNRAKFIHKIVNDQYQDLKKSLNDL